MVRALGWITMNIQTPTTTLTKHHCNPDGQLVVLMGEAHVSISVWLLCMEDSNSECMMSTCKRHMHWSNDQAMKALTVLLYWFINMGVHHKPLHAGYFFLPGPTLKFNMA